MNKELTKKDLIKQLEDKIKDIKSYMDEVDNETTNRKYCLKQIAIKEKQLEILKQLSDKPQISEEDFDKLKDELLDLCKEVYSEAFDCGCGRNAKDMGFEDGFDCDVSFSIKPILEKYLKPQPPKDPCEVKYIGYVANQGCTWQCDCGYLETVDNDGDTPRMLNYPFCRNCGRELSEVKNEN